MEGEKVMSKGTNLFVGFSVGILVMALLNGMGTDRKKETQKGIQSEVQLTDLAEKENSRVSKKENEIYQEDICEAGVREELTNDSIHVFNNMEISQDFIKEMLLYQYIEYGIRKFNETNGYERRYSVNLQDMLPYNTQFCMKNENEEPFKTDLAKEMISELSNNLYNFELENDMQNRYMSIDTYNMKIYVYDDMVK